MKVQVEVISDTVCPWCYVGKRRLEKAMKKMPDSVSFEVKWKPFLLNPDAPKRINKFEAYCRKFGESRVKAMMPAMKEAGRADGIEFSFGGDTGNTVNSHRLIEYADRFGKQDQVVETLFRYYFEEEKNMGEEDVLLAAAKEAGLDVEETKKFLESEELVAEVRKEASVNSRKAMGGVPHFLINGRYQLHGAQDVDTFVELFETVTKTSQL
eukprot:CAMPEP_0177665102 /NCGR_PEP_ID=MMETSP0447-20121125/20867_1 /TAXON_ID=0 /ORGANISM="Stygamoeba regulata, Strain BSH-02190019" /LENGTH=210 /DNA_ID=CAMNT_0019171157 /DNA_START=44 /DNA_END=676 /DNA_ORIENTATION=-